jgi:hypothetical protein
MNRNTAAVVALTIALVSMWAIGESQADTAAPQPGSGDITLELRAGQVGDTASLWYRRNVGDAGPRSSSTSASNRTVQQQPHEHTGRMHKP